MLIGGQELTVSVRGEIVAVNIDVDPYTINPDVSNCCQGDEGGQSVVVSPSNECCTNEVRE